MHSIVMLSLLVAAFVAFGWSAARRMSLLKIGAPARPIDHPGKRLSRLLSIGVGQSKMLKYRGAGLLHVFVFFGFLVLLLRTLILWGRGFNPGFSLWILAPSSTLGALYCAIKDLFIVLVLIGVKGFFIQRLLRRPKRLTVSSEALVILGIIGTMMVADIVYDASSFVLYRLAWEFPKTQMLSSWTCAQIDTITLPYWPEHPSGQLGFTWSEPLGSLVGTYILAHAPPNLLIVLAHIGYWTHVSLVLIFLNLLPYSKHFHVITALPNVYLASLDPPGRLPPLALPTSEKPASEALMDRIGDGSDPDKFAEPGMVANLGAGRVHHLTWKSLLDLYTCTECGRCTDHCPAAKTGKLLSPKQFTLDLRDHLYEFGASRKNGQLPAQDLVVTSEPDKGVIHPDVLWACTTCRACEEQCPVMISYVDKIIDVRRHLVLLKGEVPSELERPFQAMETNGNPWNLSRIDRAAWAAGLDVPTLAQKPDAKVLYWVGCAASYDDRAKKTARAFAQLLKIAGVDFAILGSEETCTGDSARRAGNEYLFALLAEQNVETFKKYDVANKQIVTACPHCFNTLANEYPDFGFKGAVTHHATFLNELIEAGKLKPRTNATSNGAATYHDSCYLGRYNGIYEAPRAIAKRIGLPVIEAESHHEKGLCCGAGGAQMWMEEKGSERINARRTKELLATGAKTVAAACPFCMTMLTDGIKGDNKEDSVQCSDVAELLLAACKEP